MGVERRPHMDFACHWMTKRCGCVDQEVVEAVPQEITGYLALEIVRQEILAGLRRLHRFYSHRLIIAAMHDANTMTYCRSYCWGGWRLEGNLLPIQ